MRIIPFTLMLIFTAAAVAGTTVAELESLDTIAVPSTVPTVSRVYVFTDTSCGYCVRLHEKRDALLRRGIAIHYLFFPREGLDSESFRQAVAVWCSADRIGALDRAMRGDPLAEADCEHPVREHYQLALELGLFGTPAIVTADGRLTYGVPTEQQILEIAARSRSGR